MFTQENRARKDSPRPPKLSVKFCGHGVDMVNEMKIV